MKLHKWSRVKNIRTIRRCFTQVGRLNLRFLIANDTEKMTMNVWKLELQCNIRPVNIIMILPIRQLYETNMFRIGIWSCILCRCQDVSSVVQLNTGC